MAAWTDPPRPWRWRGLRAFWATGATQTCQDLAISCSSLRPRSISPEGWQASCSLRIDPREPRPRARSPSLRRTLCPSPRPPACPQRARTAPPPPLLPSQAPSQMDITRHCRGGEACLLAGKPFGRGHLAAGWARDQTRGGRTRESPRPPPPQREE